MRKRKARALARENWLKDNGKTVDNLASPSGEKRILRTGHFLKGAFGGKRKSIETNKIRPGLKGHSKKIRGVKMSVQDARGPPEKGTSREKKRGVTGGGGTRWSVITPAEPGRSDRQGADGEVPSRQT